MTTATSQFAHLYGQRHELGGPFGRVDALFYEAVRLQVESELWTLEPGNAYTSRQICNEGFWSRLGKLERLQAGMCLRDLVKRGLVELLPVPRKGKSKYPLLYQRK